MTQATNNNLYLAAQKIWRSLTSAKFRSRIARIRYVLSDSPVLLKPTFADDGLISQHITGFFQDSKFMEAYELGRQTGALKTHPGDVHFRAYVVCWAAKYALKLDGDFVECGVGAGMFSRILTHYVDFENTNKKLYLFDTYSGIPLEDAKSSQERENMALLNNTHFHKDDFYGKIGQTFSKYPNVILVKGKVPDSFKTITLNSISYISIDMNNATAEIAAIEYLWGKLVFGGVVVLDDYAYGEEFIEQKIAWDKFAKLHNFDILTLPTGQGLIIKNCA